MTDPVLSPELVSLVHHVELNKAGWWDRATQRLIVATIVLSGKSLSLGEILQEMRKRFALDPDPAKVKEQVEVLCGTGLLVRGVGDQIKVSEQGLTKVREEASNAERVQRKVKTKFTDILARLCPALDAEQTWRMVNEQFFLPWIRNMGARTYEIVSGAAAKLDGVVTFQDFLERFPAEHRIALGAAVSEFWDPKDPNVRSFILGCLNTLFILEAGSLRDTTIRKLEELLDKRPSWSIFVDTNFLFSILGLHENPSNEAALALMDLIKKLSGRVGVRLYVAPPTVDEVKKVLGAARDGLKGLNLTTELAEAAAETRLPGVWSKFFEEYKRSRGVTKADDYFEPYLRNPIAISRARGVEFYNENWDSYRKEQAVIDDVLEQTEFEKKRGQAAKSYEGLMHDVLLWHVALKKRPARVESPLDAGFWIVTVDYRFLGFDAFKTRGMGMGVPVCLHPTILIQLLQFWVPRTAEFEEVIVGSMRMPLLFTTFDIEAERITVRILQALGRFNNVRDLDRRTVSRLLVSEALRQKIKAEGSVGREMELVREALAEENRKTREELDAAKARAGGLAEQVRAKSAEVERLKREIAGQVERLKEVETNRVVDLEDRATLEQRIKDLEEDMRVREEKSARARERRRFFGGPVVGSLAALALAVYALWFVLAKFNVLETRQALIAEIAGGLIAWIWLVDAGGTRNPVIREGKLFGWMHRFKNWIFSVLGLILVGVIANAITEWIQLSEIMRKFRH